MKNRARWALWLSLALLMVSGVVQAQTLPYEFEFGYRKTTIDGNEQMYRSQINERSGFLLHTFTLATSDFEGGTRLFDRFRVDASDLGTGPAGALRVEASKAEVYRFTLGYRRAEVYSALPAFANPLLSKGVIPGQHTWDRTRNMIDMDLELAPGRMLAPFIGYSSNDMTGPGTTTYRAGQDEFLLSQNLSEREHEVRVGTGFTFGNKVYGSLTEGWRKLKSREEYALIGPSTGNNTTPVLGRDSSATTITRNDGNQARTPFTNFYATAQLSERVRMTGNYARLSAESNGSENEALAGSLVSFGINRYFTGLTETAAQRAKNQTWRGGVRAEGKLLAGLDVFMAYQQDHRQLNGTALINTLYTGITNFGGVDPPDVATVLNAASGMTRKDNVASFGVVSHPVGPLTMRAEYRQTKENVEVSPDLSEIVVPGSSQGGAYIRDISTVDANATLTRAGFSLGGSLRRDSADTVIVRSDYRDRNRVRVRGSYAAPKWVKLGVTAENLTQSNPDAGILMEGKVRQYSGDVEVAPVKALALRASASKFKSDSSMLYRRPENFTTDLSVYGEEGKAREGGVIFNVAPLSIDASMAKYENRGDNPFDVNRARVRVGLDIPKTKAGIVVEYAKDKYHELTPLFGDFDAKRWGIFLRVHP